MNRIEKDDVREERITNEIIVDAYGPEEQAIGWYYYLEERLAFPFQARCVQERHISPLRPGEAVEVRGVAPEEDCAHEMLVMIRWCDREMGVPLAKLEAIGRDRARREAIGDWHYWVTALPAQAGSFSGYARCNHPR
jgi:hypothetical protein